MDAAVGASTRVAVVGLGKMGSPIAERILDGGYPLAVCNRTRREGRRRSWSAARRCSTSAGEALREADVCVTMLADDDGARGGGVAPDGVLAGARPGTDAGRHEHRLGRRLASAWPSGPPKPVSATCAHPVSGNPTVVRGGTLTHRRLRCRGAAARLDPLLRAIGPKVLYVGEGERGARRRSSCSRCCRRYRRAAQRGARPRRGGGRRPRQLLEVIGRVGRRLAARRLQDASRSLRDDYSARSRRR